MFLALLSVLCNVAKLQQFQLSLKIWFVYPRLYTLKKIQPQYFNSIWEQDQLKRYCFLLMKKFCLSFIYNALVFVCFVAGTYEVLIAYLCIFYHTRGTIPKHGQITNQQWPNCKLLLFKAQLIDRHPHLQTARVLVLLWSPRKRVQPERSNPWREMNWPTLGQFACIGWWAALAESHAFQLLLP